MEQKNQREFKSDLKVIVKEMYKLEEQERPLKILKCFTRHRKELLNYLTIIMQLYLRLNINHFMEKDSKY